MSEECSCEVCGKHHIHKYNELKNYCSICGELFNLPIKELIIKYLSTFSLERLINIVNHKSGICISCEHFTWLKPSFKHNFWGCKVSIWKFEEHYNCRGKQFKPNKFFLELLEP